MPANKSMREFRPVHIDDLVRVGTKFDGGYVISQRSIQRTKALLSLGISNDWAFDSDFAKRKPGITVVGVDRSVSFTIFLRKALELGTLSIRELMHAHVNASKKAIWESALYFFWATCFAWFFFKRPHRFVNKNVGDHDDDGTITIGQLIAKNVPGMNAAGSLQLFVKMDIEGCEYEIIPTLIRLADQINGMVIEFHDLTTHWDAFSDSMMKLKEKYPVIHMHGNNWSPFIPGTQIPSVIEVSFINRRLLKEPVPPSFSQYPATGLDYPCNRDAPDSVLNFEP